MKKQNIIFGCVAFVSITAAVVAIHISVENDKEYKSFKRDLSNRYNNICEGFNRTYKAYTDIDEKVSKIEKELGL